MRETQERDEQGQEQFQAAKKAIAAAWDMDDDAPIDGGGEYGRSCMGEG